MKEIIDSDDILSNFVDFINKRKKKDSPNQPLIEIKKIDTVESEELLMIKLEGYELYYLRNTILLSDLDLKNLSETVLNSYNKLEFNPIPYGGREIPDNVVYKLSINWNQVKFEQEYKSHSPLGLSKILDFVIKIKWY